MEIVDFFRRLNDCYLDKGLYFTLILSEDMDALAIDSQLAGSDLAFFLLDAGSDGNLINLYKTGVDAFNRNGKPRIATYIRTEAGQRQEETKRLTDRLNWSSEHYINTCEHIDTVKLGLLMQLNRMDLIGVDIRLENGKAWQGGVALLSLEHVEMMAGYEDLQRLKTRRSELEERFYKAKAGYSANPDDINSYQAFFEAARMRNEAAKEIQDIETQLYHMLEGMCEQTAQGILSKRQAEGYRLMERGLLSEAKAVLDFDEIVAESRRVDDKAKRAARSAQIHVNEQLQLKDVNAALLDWESVDACYKEAVKLEEGHNLPKKATLLYVEFLRNQSRYMEGIAVAEKLLRYYENPGEMTSDADQGRLHRLLGQLYGNTQRFAEAEEVYHKALHIYLALAKQNPVAYEADIAKCNKDLGVLYGEVHRYAEAIEKYLIAKEIQARLALRAPDTFEPDLGNSYNGLGVIYLYLKQMDKAEEMLNSALKIRKRLANVNPALHEKNVIKDSLNLAYILRVVGRFSESEKLHLEAIEIAERLAGQNPDAYEPFLAHCYNNLGVLYYEAKQYMKAERMYTPALQIRKKLAARSPDAYNSELTNTYNNLAVIFMFTNRLVEAEEMHLATLEIRREMAARNPDAYESDLAITLDNLGGLYLQARRTAEAEEMFMAAREIWQRLVAANPDSFETDLADNYCNYGELLKDTGRLTEAEESLRKAIQLYRKYESRNALAAEHAAEARDLLEGVRDMQAGDGALGSPGQGLFTSEEREIALLLTEGMTQREIARKYGFSADEVKRKVSAIREKVIRGSDPDQTVAAVAHEYKLTRRETDVLRLLRQNEGNDMIAAELVVSDETVRTHVRNVLKKLSLEKRQDVAAWLDAYEMKTE